MSRICPGQNLYMTFEAVYSGRGLEAPYFDAIRMN